MYFVCPPHFLGQSDAVVFRCAFVLLFWIKSSPNPRDITAHLILTVACYEALCNCICFSYFYGTVKSAVNSRLLDARVKDNARTPTSLLWGERRWGYSIQIQLCPKRKERKSTAGEQSSPPPSLWPDQARRQQCSGVDVCRVLCLWNVG